MMMKMKFTQKIKDNWISNLESGKYKQGFGKLKSKTKKGMRFCCIGVLGDCTEGLTNNSLNVTQCKNPYDFLEKNNINAYDLYCENDNFHYIGSKHTDYRNVIPLIKQLTTTE
jgi:hypothetical protein